MLSFSQIESVDLALSILDGYEFKGKKLSVEKASFDLKGKFDPSKKPKKRALKKKDREKLQKKQEKYVPAGLNVCVQFGLVAFINRIAKR